YHYSKVAVCVKRFPDPGVRELAGQAEALLVGHEVVPELDEEQIASLSRTAIQGLLRRGRRLGGAAAGGAGPAAGGGGGAGVGGAKGGADLLVRPADAVRAIDALEAAATSGRVAVSTIDRAVLRLLLTKERLGLFADRMVDIAGVEKTVGCAAHRAAADRMAF